MSISNIYNIASLDWGSVRFGLAFGNTENKLVIPFNQICLNNDILLITSTELSKRKIETLVIGIPTNFHGKDTIITAKIQQFSKILQSHLPKLTIKYINERESTKQAKLKQHASNKLDQHTLNHLAAAEILNYFLGEENRNTKH